MKYAEPDHDGMTKSQMKKKHAKKDEEGPTRLPKNLPHFNFEDERCKHSTFAKDQSIKTAFQSIKMHFSELERVNEFLRFNSRHI